jgi:uncharacterized protein
MKKIRIILTLAIALVCCLMLAGCKKPYENQPPLIRAIAQNKPSTVMTLLKHGANANESLANGATALMVAAAVGNSNIVQMLLSHHASLNARNNDGSTALLAAAGAGNSDVAMLLIKHGANPCQKNNDGLLAFQIALKWGNHESAHKLQYTCKIDTGEHA